MACILVADDEDNVRSLLRKVLEKAGYEVIEAVDGNEALAKARSHKISLAIIDIIMPAKGGIETIMDLHKEFTDLKMIAISGKINTTSEVFQMLVKQFGILHILQKPIDFRELLRAVQNLLSHPTMSG